MWEILSDNDFDTIGRFAAHLEPVDLFLWLFGREAKFQRWLNVRNVPYAHAPDRIADTIGHFVDELTHGTPWAIILEIKLDPDRDVFGQVQVYEGFVYLTEFPDPEPGSRFTTGSVIINLRGHQTPFAPATLGKSPVQRTYPYVVNMADFIAEEIMSQVERRELGVGVLLWFSLMRGADEPAIIERWKQVVTERANPKYLADYATVALVFADAAGRRAVWEQALKGWNMVESSIAKEWRQQARKEGRDEGRKAGLDEGLEKGESIGRIELMQQLLHLPVNTRDELAMQTLEQLQQLEHRLQQQLLPNSNGSNGTQSTNGS